MKPIALDPTTISLRQPTGDSASSGSRGPGLDLGRHGSGPRLSAEEEADALRGLAQLREQRWAAVLREPTVRTAVAEQLRALEHDQPAQWCEQDTDLPVAELARKLRLADTDGSLIERVTDTVEAELSGSGDVRRVRTEVRRARRKYVRARNRFVCQNLRLVVKIANRYSGRWMSLADRVQEGNLGLIKAVERFDTERGTRFSTYAVWWIRHAITRSLVNRGRTVRVPAHLHGLATKIRRARPALEGELGRPASHGELAEHLGVDEAKVVDADQALSFRSVSLEGTAGDDEHTAWSDRLGEPPPQRKYDAWLDHRRTRAVALRALQSLSQRDREIVTRRFALDGGTKDTLEVLSRHYDISRERVRQLQKRALKKIRGQLESHQLLDAVPA